MLTPGSNSLTFRSIQTNQTAMSNVMSSSLERVSIFDSIE
jgi:hypothetical protein